jgi:hypothetical protein
MRIGVERSEEDAGRTLEMILVDTSAWIASFRRQGITILKFLRQAIVAGHTQLPRSFCWNSFRIEPLKSGIL